LGERVALDRGRHDQAEQHTDLDGSVPGADVGPHEERTDRELGLGLAGDEDLPVRGGRRRRERQRREERPVKSEQA
jgi:hypothetical protein